jgi:hypothetical protein
MFIKNKARHFSRLARFTQNRCFFPAFVPGFRAAACQQLIAGQMTSSRRRERAGQFVDGIPEAGRKQHALRSPRG